MADFHEAEFFWPHTDALNVIVTGTFDNWSSSVHLARTDDGFRGTARVPWGERTLYKFVVDGRWTNHDDHPTEADPAGNINNVYVAPQKPMPAPPAPTKTNGEIVAEPEKALPNGKASDEINTEDVPVKVETTPAANGTNGLLEPTGLKTPESDDSDRRSFVADIADTIAAREGASTPMGYVASAIGAAINSVVGVDPVNGTHIAIPTPKEATFTDVPAPTEDEAKPPKEPLDMAPDVPVEIVPVNAAENTTVPAPETVTRVPDVPAETPAVIAVADTTAAVVAAPEPTPAPERTPSPVAVEMQGAPITPSTHSPIGASVPHLVTPVNGNATPIAEEKTAEEKPAESDTTKDLPAPPAVVETPASRVSAPEAQPAIEEVAAPKSDDSKPVAVEKPETEVPKTPPKAESKGEPQALIPPSPTTPSPSAPSTPAKSHGHRFPSFSSPRKSLGGNSVESSPTASNTGTVSSMRKKRTSIFGKISHIFKHDKDKEGKEATE